MPLVDYEARRDYLREYKRKNRTRILARRRELYVKKGRKLLSQAERKAKKAIKDKRWRERHKADLKERKRQYYQNNKEVICRRTTLRRNSNIQVKLAANLRNRIRSAILKQYKVGSAVRDLGCSIQEFITYIEQQFTPGMSWDNYGSWHLDHIMPLSSFDLADRKQFLLACNFTNYQPLWALDNIRKSRHERRVLP